MFRRVSNLYRGFFLLVGVVFPLTLILEKIGDILIKQPKGKLSIPELWYTTVNFSKPDDISCYNETRKDEIFEDILNKFVFPNTVFFHVTACSRDLPLRQACAIESAARSYPDRQVAVLFTKPLTCKECSPGPLEEVFKLGNVDYFRVNLSRYAVGTPLEMIFKGNLTSNSMRVHRRVAEYLKFLTLYRYGGTVLDLEMMVTPQMDYLISNLVLKGDDNKLGSTIISMAKNELGEKLAREFLSALAEQAELNELDGGRAMYDVLKRHCNTSDVNEMKFSTCKVHIQGNDNFAHPVKQSTWLEYLEPAKRPDAMYAAYYIRDSENNDQMIPPDSLYAKIARKYCPKQFEKFISEFVDVSLRGTDLMGESYKASTDGEGGDMTGSSKSLRDLSFQP